MTYRSMVRLLFVLLGVAACGSRPDRKTAATTTGGAAAAPATVPITTASAEARQHFLTGLCRQVAAAARLGVVCMGVRDDRALDGIPGIDIEIPRLTIKAVARRLNEW